MEMSRVHSILEDSSLHLRRRSTAGVFTKPKKTKDLGFPSRKIETPLEFHLQWVPDAGDVNCTLRNLSMCFL